MSFIPATVSWSVNHLSPTLNAILLMCRTHCVVSRDSPEVCGNIVSEEARVKDELLEEVVGRKQNAGYHCCTLRCWANTLRQWERRGVGRGGREVTLATH